MTLRALSDRVVAMKKESKHISLGARQDYLLISRRPSGRGFCWCYHLFRSAYEITPGSFDLCSNSDLKAYRIVKFLRPDSKMIPIQELPYTKSGVEAEIREAFA